MTNLKLKGRIIEKFGTQWGFAKAVDAREAFISKIVRGHRKLADAEQKMWAQTLEAEVQELFGKESSNV